MTTRTIPEWPEASWKFDEPLTYFFYNICSEGVGCERGRSAALVFGRYAQHPRSIAVHLSEPPPKRGGWSRNQTWPDAGWLVIVKGWHERKGKERIEQHRGGATIYSGEQPIALDDFNEWLIREKLELLVDLRGAAMAEGWGPPYAGCACDPPRLPPLHLAHWYPDRTWLTCAPSREEWTRFRQEYYIDHDDHVHDPGLSYNPWEHGTAEELWTAISSLEIERRILAQEQKKAKRKFPHLFRRKGETRHEWTNRYYKMTRAEQDQLSELDTSGKRQVIFQAVKALKAGSFPEKYHPEAHLPAIQFLFERLERAENSRRKTLLAQAAKDFPTDDAAWEQELESRREKERARLEQLKVTAESINA